MSVHDLTSRRRPTMAVSNVTPMAHRFRGTTKGLVVALGLMKANDLPECTVNVWNEGQVVVFDYSSSAHPVGDVTVACKALGFLVGEHPGECPDGTAAREFRGADYQDGILRVVRALVPIPGADPRVLALAEGADERRETPAVPDDLDALRGRTLSRGQA